MKSTMSSLIVPTRRAWEGAIAGVAVPPADPHDDAIVTHATTANVRGRTSGYFLRSVST